ncbi:hypothetical protein BJ508DRAFT_366106 [Ascobolus immersus RN42]|uniref:Decapping nuclease n=1 Tax=Ascobolus immersus RN42 TaxID=1160509 RepID=A0A3N4HNV8_ASCIM|nr:hypothetical protein BJ508DRAFT_366106 [Ascobolus immersus RN42]
MEIPHEIPHSSIIDDPTLTSGKTNFTALASYSWLNCSQTPTIAVPGHPAIWTPKPPGTITTLEPDRGTYFSDQNAARHPSSPLEPIFRALAITDPSFSFDNIDIVTDRTVLRKLFRFIRAGHLGKRDRFQFAVQRVGGVTLFTRNEVKTTDYFRGDRGYGFAFEKEFTCWPKGLEDSTGHHRVVKYNLCGSLGIMMRFEADAAVLEHNADDCSTSLERLLARPTERKELKVREAGKMVAHEEVVELKAAHVKTDGRFACKGVYEQLWLANTPRLLVGLQQNGVFGDIRDVDTTVDSIWKREPVLEGPVGINKWELDNEAFLRKLAVLLKTICEIAEKADGKALVIRCDDESLKVEAGEEGKEWIPKDLRDWIETGSSIKQ